MFQDCCVCLCQDQSTVEDHQQGMEQLSGQDASFVYFETPKTHMHISGLAVYDQSTARKGRVRFRDIVENVRSRLHLAKCFRRRLVEVP